MPKPSGTVFLRYSHGQPKNTPGPPVTNTIYKGGGNGKEHIRKCEDYGKNRKADISFTWKKQGDGSANLVSQIMVG
jgi:hypothetical protein